MKIERINFNDVQRDLSNDLKSIARSLVMTMDGRNFDDLINLVNNIQNPKTKSKLNAEISIEFRKLKGTRTLF